MKAKSSTRKPNIAMCAAFVLFCLTLFSMHFTSGLYARYVARDSAEDSARVIKFGNLMLTENVEWNDGEEILVPGKDITKQVIIESSEGLLGGKQTSEVDTYVFVVVDDSDQEWTYTSNTKTFKTGEYISWSVTDDWTYLGEDAGLYVYYRYLEANEKLDETHFIKNDTITVSDKLTKEAINGLPADLSIDIQVALVQANGFESVQDAWNSIVE